MSRYQQLSHLAEKALNASPSSSEDDLENDPTFQISQQNRRIRKKRAKNTATTPVQRRTRVFGSSVENGTSSIFSTTVSVSTQRPKSSTSQRTEVVRGRGRGRGRGKGFRGRPKTASSSFPTCSRLSSSSSDGDAPLWESSSDDEVLATIRDRTELDWREFDASRFQIFTFNEPTGPSMIPNDPTPLQLWKLFVTDDLLALLCHGTNEYAELKGFVEWNKVDNSEMLKFLGILMYMGLVNLPVTDYYWSKSPLYYTPLVRTIFSRQRFRELSQAWHFRDISEEKLEEDEFNKLWKVQLVLDSLNQSFQRHFKPGQSLVIDESLIPWRGRLAIKQYIPSKAHKFGIKLFKLCDPQGYVLKFVVYAGKGTVAGIYFVLPFTILYKFMFFAEKEGPASQQIVLRLMEPYLDQGRCLYTDNWYTTVPLAELLLKRKTHLTGTVRANRKGNPKDNDAVEKGEQKSVQLANGVSFTRFNDKRLVRILSTCYSPTLKGIGKKNREGIEIKKPSSIQAYNVAKCGVDKSDQMNAYNSALRQTKHWTRRLVMDLLMGTSTVNAWTIYKTVCYSHLCKSLQIYIFLGYQFHFRDQVVS